MSTLACGHDSSQQWWGTCRRCEHEAEARYWNTPGYDHSRHDHTLGGECADSPPLLLREKALSHRMSHTCLVCGAFLNDDYTHARGEEIGQ